MLIKEYVEKLSIPQKIFSNYSMKKTMFFDIETTGFDKDKNKIILISSGWFVDQSTFYIRQYFAENLEEETKILNSFSNDTRNFDICCSYNGKAFDEPFLKKRMCINNLGFKETEKHIDLYRIIRPYYKQLGIERCNLKSVEEFLGIKRKDNIDGSISVELYFEFLSTKKDELINTIMLHNYEDVLNLPKIFKIVHKIDNDTSLTRENHITEKQVKHLKYLLKKHNININGSLNKISKKAASRIIHSIIKGEIDEKKFQNMIDNSY